MCSLLTFETQRRLCPEISKILNESVVDCFSLDSVREDIAMEDDNKRLFCL